MTNENASILIDWYSDEYFGCRKAVIQSRADATSVGPT